MNTLPINIAIVSPTPTLAVAGTTGTLPAATYFVRVVAKMAVGPGGTVPGTVDKGVFNNVAGTEASQAVTLGQILTVTIPFTAGITHYDIYVATVTNTEIYCYTVAAAPYFAATTFAIGAPLPTGGALYSTVAVVAVFGSTSAGQLPGNAFTAGGNQGPLYSGAFGGPFYNGPGGPGSPFILGRGAVISNPTGAAITISASDGTAAFATWFTTPATAGFYDIQQLAGYGRNLAVNGFTGLPPYLVASAAGAYLLGSP